MKRKEEINILKLITVEIKIFCLIFLVSVVCYSCKKEKNKEENIYKDTIGSVVIDGSTLAYTIKGKGTPILLIGSDAEYFSKDFFEKFQVYSIQMRFNAEKYKPVDLDLYTIDNLYKDIDSVRSILGLKRCIVAGHSVLGAIAYKYAQRYPEYVSHVVMLGTPRTWGTSEYKNTVNEFWENAPKERRLLYHKNLERLKEEQYIELNEKERFVKRLVASGPKRWHNQNLDATPFFKRVNYNLEFLFHFFEKVMPSYDMCLTETKTTIPVFVAIGKSDYIAPFALWNATCEHISDFEVAFFEESGHTPQFEEQKLFNERLFRWYFKN